MEEAQRIACTNDAWVVMSFAARGDACLTDPAGDMAKGQRRVVDIASYPFPEGLAFRPEVTVAMDGRPSSPPEPPSIIFKMNGRTAFYDVTGVLWNWEVRFKELGEPSGRPSLPDFPASIPVSILGYTNWDRQIEARGLLTCAPQSAADVVAVCNWARDSGYQVRPRGVMHGWAPLTVRTNPEPGTKVILVDLTKRLCEATFLGRSSELPSRVKVQTGMTMLELLKYLERQAGGRGSAPGYSFPHTPAPGHVTVGGVLAIDAHGTAVPTPPDDDVEASYGSLSNQILEFTAVVTDPDSANPDQYVLRTFDRGESDAKAFLTHLGRAFLVDATLQVIDNYNLRCQSFTKYDESVLFATPTSATRIPPDSFADHLSRYGRVEVIWFRTGTKPWLHVWSVAPNRPDGARAVSGPYNYPFADHVPDSLQRIVGLLLDGVPAATSLMGEMAASVTASGLDGKNVIGEPVYAPSRDIWGPSKDVLLYIQDTTLRVTANGYALQMRRADVQQAVVDLTTKFASLLASYEAHGKYPVNSAVEIRVTSLDDPTKVARGSGLKAESPVISALSDDELAKQNGWDVALWVDVLTIPGTAHSNEFYAELEAWMLERFSGERARCLPEWSKGWGYTADQGPWTSPQFFDHIRRAFTAGRGDRNNWQFEVTTLRKYDKFKLFTSPLLDRLFTTEGP